MRICFLIFKTGGTLLCAVLLRSVKHTTNSVAAQGVWGYFIRKLFTGQLKVVSCKVLFEGAKVEKISYAPNFFLSYEL
jgi:hypothetical protein